MAEGISILCPICHKPNLRRARFCQHCGADVVLNNDAPSDERRYVITRVIKQGGQGAVYEGIEVDHDNKVYAIKEMLDKFTDPKERAEAIARFEDEATLLQSLKHPRVPQVYSHFRDEGRHYLTMDFVRGEDLEQIIERDGPQPEARVLEWADQICDVLDHLHGKGLIYRDMKPSNVMIERQTGGVKLVDFGIAKLFKPTERGTQIGTPGYAPPEQYQGLATPQSDVYALGATLHHLLTGRDPTEQMPFSFPRADQVQGVTISKTTADALEKALQKVAQDRFPTIRAFWDALRPGRTAQRPAQVRVAPATTRIPQPAAAQVGTAPPLSGRPAPAAAPAPARPAARPAATQPAPTAAPAPARPAPQPQQPARPAQPARRGGFLGCVRFVANLIVVTLLLAVIGMGAFIYYQRPAWAEPYVGPLLELIPTATVPTPTTLTAQEVTYELEVRVPTGADSATILAEFRAAFEQVARSQYGPNTRVFSNRPPAYVDSPKPIGEESGQTTYRARMVGFIYQQ